jgi:ketosteroid isomerase-like protein
MLYKLFFICGLLLFVSCTEQENGEEVLRREALEEVVAADKAFAERCASAGMKTAFLEYVSSEAVLLRPGYLPIAEDRVVRYLTAMEDTSFVMSWKPTGADVSLSGDLGYTYGTYQVTAKDTVLKGTYLSVWRKQTDGSWKFVIDSGNAGADREFE